MSGVLRVLESLALLIEGEYLAASPVDRSGLAERNLSESAGHVYDGSTAPSQPIMSSSAHNSHNT